MKIYITKKNLHNQYFKLFFNCLIGNTGYEDYSFMLSQVLCIYATNGHDNNICIL